MGGTDTSGPVTIGVPNVPYFVEGLRQLMPHAQFQPLRTVDEVFADNAAFDAVALPAERGSAWTLLHPQLLDGCARGRVDQSAAGVSDRAA